MGKISQNRLDSGLNMNAIELIKKSNVEKVKSIINEVSQLRKQRNELVMTSTPVVSKSKSVLQVKVNELKNGGTPARLEETKQIRAKIREEQLLRLQKQKEGKTKNNLVNQGWRKVVVQRTKEMDNYTANDEHGNNFNDVHEKCDKRESAKIPVMERVSCPYKDSSSKKTYSNLKAVQDSTQKCDKAAVMSERSQNTLSSRLSNLKLMESRLQRENDEMSQRILSSPGVKRKASSVPSKYPSTQSIPIKFESTINSCNYAPSKSIINASSVSKLQQFTALKGRSR